MALRGKHRATAALVAVLKTINGPAGGFWIDFGERVFRREVRPEDVPGVPLPFLCAPKIRSAPAFEDLEARGMIAVWQQPILIYVAEEGVGLEDVTAPDLLDKGQDDVIRAVMADWTLGGTVSTSRFVEGGDSEGALMAEDYGELELILELTQHFGRADLGPDATA